MGLKYFSINLAKNVSATDINFILILTITITGYLSYYFIAFPKKGFGKINRVFSIHLKKNDVNHVLFQKVTGFLFMGLLPFVLVSAFLPKTTSNYGLSYFYHPNAFFFVLTPSVILLILNFFFAGNPENLKQYPQMRIKQWTNKTLVLNALGWFVYLLGYEYLFRGVLFLGILPSLGLYAAIALNAAVYSLAHLPKGIKETLGSIPLGILICLITFETGTIWAAFLIHFIMAVSNEYIALYHHPEMHYRRQKNLNTSMPKKTD